MLIKRRSRITGVEHTREVPVTQELLEEWAKSGRTIQEVMPYLSAEDREFLMSGITPEEWKTYIGPDDD